MSNIFKNKNINSELWRGIAKVSAVFTILVCMLIIANYLQSNRFDPVNVKTMNVLIERMLENPEDTQLRNEIRTLDLLARKAYFTNQWQIKTGVLLLIFGVSLFLISLRILAGAKKTIVNVSSDSKSDIKSQQLNARKWIVVSGVALVVVTLVVSVFTYQDMGSSFIQESASLAKAEKDANEDVKSDVSNDSESTSKTVTDTKKITTETVPVVTKKVDVKTTDAVKPTENIKKDENVTNKANPNSETKKSKIATKSSKSVKGKVDNNFPSFRGHNGNGVVIQKGVPTSWDGASGKNIAWKIPIALQGYNSPVIWGNRLFLSGASASKREVYCIDKRSGKTLWTANADFLKGSPKAPKVTPDTGHAAASVSTNGKYVYAIFSNGDIFGFNMKGKIVWSRNLGLPDNHYGHSSSLLIHKDKVIVQYDHSKESKLMALSTKTGKTVWSTARDSKISWASPIIVNTGARTEIILCAQPAVASYDVNSGAELWKLDCISGEVGPSAVHANGIVFAVNEYSSLSAIKLGDTPKLLWSDDEFLSDVPSPVATDKHLFLATSYGVIACYESQTGTKLWETEIDNGFYSSPILVNDNVYIIDREGVTHIFKAEGEFKSVSQSALGEKSDCTPAFSDGKIFIRTQKNLFCIGK